MMDSKPIEKFNDSLDSYLSIIKTHIENFKEQFEDENFNNLLNEWTLKHQNIELGFNVFELISKTFYRENFHSYILKGILEFEEDGQQVFIKSFAEFLKNNPQNQ